MFRRLKNCIDVRTMARRANAGMAAIEFAVIVPVFLVLLMGGVDMGQMLFAYYKLDQAVASGSQYAVLNAGEVNSTSGATLATNIATVVESANGSAWANDTVVVNNGPSATATNGGITMGGTASNADSCYCPSGSPGSWSFGNAKNCNASCDGGGNATTGKYVTITATYAYSPMIKIFSFLNNTTLSQSAMVQTQ